ncbi:hypothetical protein PanWU01x14_178510, partial [Parasponia andersonii]
MIPKSLKHNIKGCDFHEPLAPSIVDAGSSSAGGDRAQKCCAAITTVRWQKSNSRG